MKSLNTLSLAALTAIFVSCGGKSDEKSAELEIPSLEEQVREELAPFIKKTTINHMDKMGPFIELEGPEIKVVENAAAGIAKMDVAWTMKATEDLYTATGDPNVVNSDGRREVIYKHLSKGDVRDVRYGQYIFEVQGGIPLLSKQKTDSTIFYNTGNERIKKPLSFYGTDYLIKGSAEYDQWAAKAKEEKAVADEKARIKREEIAQKEAAQAEKNREALLESFQAKKSYEGVVRCIGRKDNWRMVLNEIELIDRAGELFVEFNLSMFSSSKSYSKFEGQFNKFGELEGRLVTRYSTNLPRFARYDDAALVFKPSGHSDKLILEATQNNYEYKGELFKQ